MATLKEIAAKFGMDIADDKDFDLSKFTDHVNSKYITRDAALNDSEIQSKIVGKTLGTLESKIISAFGLKHSDAKDKKIEEVIELVAGKTKTEIDALKLQATEGADKRVTDLTKQLEDTKKSMGDFEKLATETKTTFDAFKSESEGKFKTYKIADKQKSVLSAISFVDGFDKSEVQKAGFNTVIGNKYQFDLNDKDELVIKNKEGHLIPSKVKTGEHATPAEILALEAEANGLLKKNNATPVKKVIDNNGGGNGQGDNTPKGFRINPAAVANAER